MAQDKEKKLVEGWESTEAIHPGEFLRDELDDNNMTQIEIAERIGMHKKIINDIVTGKNPITRSTAVRLAKVFGTSAEYWVNLQSIYDNDKARLEEAKRIETEIELFIHNPDIREMYRELVRLGILEKCAWIPKNYTLIIKKLQNFFAVDSLKYVENNIFATIFRNYNREKVNRYSIAAWLRISELKAKKMEVASFDKQALKSILSELKKLSCESPEKYLLEIEKMLASVGVVIVFAPYLKNSHVQGATYWIDDNKACIVIKTTKQSEDKFWFNLFHEIGHLILGHSKKKILIDIQDGERDTCEQEADKFAQRNLIPKYKSRIKEFSDYRKAIDSISREEGISKSIVAGRLAHEYRDEKKVWALTSEYIGRIDYVNVQVYF